MSVFTAASVGIDDLRRASARADDPKVRDYLASVNSPYAGMMRNLASGGSSQFNRLSGMVRGMLGDEQVFGTMGGAVFPVAKNDGSGPSAAPVPAQEEQVAGAEATVGGMLPLPLRDFYTLVANGGVGPGEGIYSLEKLVLKHHELTSEPAGPQGQAWPENLLPIQGSDDCLVSINRETGELIYWDLEEVDIDEDGSSETSTWNNSFKLEASSLEEWLGKWAPE
jgi:hypothetical protein